METITFISWADFNPRGDLVHPSWFRMDANIGFSRALHKLDADQKWFFVFLLGLACPKKGGPVIVDIDYWEEYSGCSRKKIQHALNILKQNRTIKITHNPAEPEQTCTDIARAERILPTNERDETNETNDLSEGRISDEIRPAEICEKVIPVKTELPARAKRGRPPKAPDPSGEAVGKVIAAYVTAFQTRYGKQTRPELGGKTRGLIGTLLKQTPLERLCLLVQAYCQMDDKWFATKAHDFPTFYENIGKVGVALDLGRNDPAKRGWRELLADQEAAKAKRLEAGVA